MAGHATAFRQMWWRNVKVVALAGIVGLVLLWILLAHSCSAGLNKCGGKSGGDE
ncbi:hypothetical protein DFH09DRAFT_1131467 [Mycena vulgaris]|nr:hypothetical protein DFH09DRAFT_1131467 [Mycena vulgaris]